jgi:hypothetical protein
MSNKTEIKVYLPTKMVGELEVQKKAGVRSQFIREAIRFKLDGEAEYDIRDVSTEEVLDSSVYRLRALTEESRNFALVELIRRVLQ